MGCLHTLLSSGHPANWGIWWSLEPKVVRNGLMVDLFQDAQTSFRSKLQATVQRLAASNIFIGTSSWKYVSVTRSTA